MYQHAFQAIEPQASSASLRGGTGRDAPWPDCPATLDPAAHLPTQLACFVDAIAETYCADSVIDILQGFDAAGTAAMLPLCRDRGYFARWRIVGTREVFEPTDAFAPTPDAMQALARALVRQPRALSFDRLPGDSAMIPALRTALRERGRFSGWVSVRPAVGRPMISLDAGWAHPLARFNPGRQSDFRRALRKAERRGDVQFDVRSPSPAEFDALFDEVIAVELRSWKREAGSALGLDATKQAFFARFLRGACAQRLCRIAFLRIDGRAVAAQVALEWADRFWLFKIGYDADYRDCSPGNLLMLHTIGEAAAKGLKSYELLGNTERWISLFWTQEEHPCVRLRTYPANLRGLAAIAIDAAAWFGCRLSRRRK